MEASRNPSRPPSPLAYRTNRSEIQNTRSHQTGSKDKWITSDNSVNVGYKNIYTRCYVCEGSHKLTTVLNGQNSLLHQWLGILGMGLLAASRGGLIAGLFASVDIASALAPNAIILLPGRQRENEFWVGNSCAAEHMAQDPADLEKNKFAPTEECVQITGIFLVSAEGYGRLYFLVDQRNGKFTGPACELTSNIAHMPNHGQHFQLSVKRQERSFDPPMGLNPDAAVLDPRSGCTCAIVSSRKMDGETRNGIITRSSEALAVGNHTVPPGSWIPEANNFLLSAGAFEGNRRNSCGWASSESSLLDMENLPPGGGVYCYRTCPQNVFRGKTFYVMYFISAYGALAVGGELFPTLSPGWWSRVWEPELQTFRWGMACLLPEGG